MEHREFVLSLSYGKDSLACLGAIKELGWPLTRIVHAEVWATDDIPADLPPMVEFKAEADKIIKERWGIDVEHVRSGKTFEAVFYSVFSKSKSRNGQIYGFPPLRRSWCKDRLKIAAIKAAKSSARNSIQYIGIAADEQNRFHNLSETQKAHLSRQAGQRRIAASGARITIYCPRSTPQQHAADVGSVPTKALASFGFCAGIIRICLPYC